MATSGLILAPEIVAWRQPFADGTARKTEIKQIRACFTELSESELADHSATFGDFSLEFDIPILRAHGATPVIYMPQGLVDDDMSVLASNVVAHLQDAKYTITQLY